MHRSVLALGLAAASAQAFLIPSSISLPDLVVKDAENVDEDPIFRILDSGRIKVDSAKQAWSDELEQARGFIGDAIEVAEDEYRDLKSWSLLAYAGTAAGSDIDVKLDCPGCAFPTEHGDIQTSRENTINLKWSISPDGKALLVNGQPVLPHPLIQDSIYAKQQSGSEFSKLRQLSFLTSIDTEALSDGAVHDLTFCVLGLDDDETVDFGADGCMDVSLFEKDGSLHLVSVSTEPQEDIFENIFHATPLLTPDHEVEAAKFQRGPCADKTGLADMMCKLHTAVHDKAAEWNLFQPSSGLGRHHLPGHHHEHEGLSRPCSGFKFRGDNVGPPKHALALPLHGGPRKFAHRLGGNWNEEQGEYYGHQAHHVMHVFASFIRGFFFGFVVPIAIGMIAGLAASILGMLIGSLIGYLWVKLVRGGKRGNVTAAQLAREARVDEEDALSEKELLDEVPAFTDGEAPPLYAEKE